MNALANAIAAAPADIPDPRQRQRRISARIRRACAALIQGEAKTITDAAAIAKIRREALSIALHKPHVIEHLRVNACRALAIAAGRAAAVKVELLDSASEHVRNDASAFVLALAGIKPVSDPQVNLSIELKAGYVIDLTGDGHAGRRAGSSGNGQIIQGYQAESEDSLSS